MKMRDYEKLPHEGHYFWRTKGETKLLMTALGATVLPSWWRASPVLPPVTAEAASSPFRHARYRHVMRHEEPNVVFLSRPLCPGVEIMGGFRAH